MTELFIPVLRCCVEKQTDPACVALQQCKFLQTSLFPGRQDPPPSSETCQLRVIIDLVLDGAPSRAKVRLVELFEQRGQVLEVEECFVSHAMRSCQYKVRGVLSDGKRVTSLLHQVKHVVFEAIELHVVLTAPLEATLVHQVLVMHFECCFVVFALDVI